MGHPFSITIQIPGHDDLKARGEFTDEEHEQLVGYLEQYESLCESKPVREGVPCNYKLKWDREEGVSFTASLPDRDTLSILLHELRPFILSEEPSSFERVTGILGRRIDSKHMRWALKEQRELYDGRASQQMMTVSTTQGMILNSEEMLRNWLNAHEYHRDPDKRAEIDELLEWLPGELGLATFVSLLMDKVRAIGNVAALAALALGRTDKLQMQLHERE